MSRIIFKRIFRLDQTCRRFRMDSGIERLDT